MLPWNRRSFLLGAGLAATSAWAKQTDVRSHIESERKIIVDAMARDDIPGVAVCFIADGKPVWTEGFGVTDRASKRAIQSDTIFSVQSTSKNFTATAIMLAVQQGLLDLDEPITSYLPDFTVNSRFEPAPQKKMTLRILLGNRAGFTHEAPVGNNFYPEFPSFEAHVRSISQTWLRFPVGERYRYSNLGFDLAGYILQVRSGMPFAQWLTKMLFEPLGMKDSTVATEVYASRTNRAVGHQRGYETVPLKTPLIPSGGVYTSARDIAAYCMFHLNRGRANGQTLLKEELWNEMHSFAFGGDYSLGVIRSELRFGDTDLRWLSHAGGGFGFGSVFNYGPDAGFAWAALFNRPVSAAYRFGKHLLDQTVSERFGPAKPRLRIRDLAPVKLPVAWAQKYVGSYVGRGSTVEIKIKDGTPGLQEGDAFRPMNFNAPDEIYVAGENDTAVSYRYVAPSPLAPAHLECSIGEKSLDYNEGPHDVAGPDEPEWSRFVGTYRIQQWGKPGREMVVQRKHGYLYLDHIRLITELEPGLFFTADGEAVDFRGDAPTWRNIRLHRV